jgi:hypothetical protein
MPQLAIGINAKNFEMAFDVLADHRFADQDVLCWNGCRGLERQQNQPKGWH